jgi:hypothetical protein
MSSGFAVILCLGSAVLLGGAASALAQQKTAKECSAEWRANKADNQAKGITERAFVTQCRAGTPSSSSAAAPAPTPAQGATLSPPRSSAASLTGANQFASEDQAKTHCPADTVVWVNLSSKIYHYRGYKDYGITKKGAYMCEKDATAQGNRASKIEKHPS